MSEIIPFGSEEDCECPTCSLVNHFVEVLLNADFDEYRDIVEVCVQQAKELGQIQYIQREVESKEMQLYYLIHGRPENDELN